MQLISYIYVSLRIVSNVYEHEVFDVENTITFFNSKIKFQRAVGFIAYGKRDVLKLALRVSDLRKEPD